MPAVDRSLCPSKENKKVINGQKLIGKEREACSGKEKQRLTVKNPSDKMHMKKTKRKRMNIASVAQNYGLEPLIAPEQATGWPL